MRNFSGIVIWYSADHIPGMLCVEFKHFVNLYRKQQTCPRLQNWNAKSGLRMKNRCGESVGFSFKATLWFPHWFCLCKVLWDQSYNSTFRLFSLSSVMILSVSVSFLFPCFLFSLLLDQIASFQLKQIVVFFN